MFLRLEYLHRTFGLELIESVLSGHHRVFLEVRSAVGLHSRSSASICLLLLLPTLFYIGFPQYIRPCILKET